MTTMYNYRAVSDAEFMLEAATERLTEMLAALDDATHRAASDQQQQALWTLAAQARLVDVRARRLKMLTS